MDILWKWARKIILEINCSVLFLIIVRAYLFSSSSAMMRKSYFLSFVPNHKASILFSYPPENMFLTVITSFLSSTSGSTFLVTFFSFPKRILQFKGFGPQMFNCYFWHTRQLWPYRLDPSIQFLLWVNLRFTSVRNNFCLRMEGSSSCCLLS